MPLRSDTFGYTCKIARLPYVQGTDLVALTGDDAATVVQLPFPFVFYGQPYGAVSVATNGFVTFGSSNTTYTNDSIPSAATPNGAIYAYWDDMIVDNASRVYTKVIGTAPRQKFVIEWRNVTYYSDNTRRVNFEIILSQLTNTISVVYSGIAADDREQGNSATLGIENRTGDDAFQYSFNTAVISSPAFGIVYRAP